MITDNQQTAIFIRKEQRICLIQVIMHAMNANLRIIFFKVTQTRKKESISLTMPINLQLCELPIDRLRMFALAGQTKFTFFRDPYVLNSVLLKCGRIYPRQNVSLYEECSPLASSVGDWPPCAILFMIQPLFENTENSIVNCLDKVRRSL